MIEPPVGRPARELSHRRIFFLVAALLLTAAVPAFAQDSATYAARPAPSDGDRSAARFVLSVAAGSSASDAVEIFNLSDESTTFDVYAADAVRTREGGLAPASRDAEITGSAAWITVDQASVVIPPRSSTIVSFTILIPAGTGPGDQTAALLVEPQRPSSGGTLATRTRVGLWVKVQVLGAATSTYPWIPFIVLLGLLLLALLTYVSRRPRGGPARDRRDDLPHGSRTHLPGRPATHNRSGA